MLPVDSDTQAGAPRLVPALLPGAELPSLLWHRHMWLQEAAALSSAQTHTLLHSATTHEGQALPGEHTALLEQPQAKDKEVNVDDVTPERPGFSHSRGTRRDRRRLCQFQLK